MTGDPTPETSPGAAAPARRRRRWPWVTALVVLFALLVSAGAVAGSTVSYADSLEGRLLPGTVIAGIDVGSQTHQEALRHVRKVLAADLDRTMVVHWQGQRWTASARDLGARTNARGIIAKVAQSQTGLTWQDWARMRWLGEREDIAAHVRVHYRRPAVRAFIRSIADEVDVEPVDAELSVDGDSISVSEAQVGYRANRKRAVSQLMDRLNGRGRKVALRVKTLEPEVTEAAFDQVLLLDQSEHRLTLHLGGVQTHSWTVATGTGDYPTPLGRYSVTEKRYMPTWVNPSPDTWGKDLPAEIPPGKNNPLGLRALNWDAPAIRFHGTQAVDSLGTDASHGCVRMANKDVIELYDLVDVGAVIVSQS